MEVNNAKPGTYLFSYSYKGRCCGEDFKANSMEEAQARLQAIKETARLDGHLEAWIDADNDVTRMDETLDFFKRELN